MSEITTEFLTAETAVRQLHARYADAVWRKDYAAFGNCFASDCQWITSSMVMKGRSGIVETVRGLQTKLKSILLTIRTPIVELEKDGSVSSRTYFSEQGFLTDGGGYLAIATYFERFTHEEGRLRFKWRLSQAHYSGPPDLTGSVKDNPDCGAPPALPPHSA